MNDLPLFLALSVDYYNYFLGGDAIEIFLVGTVGLLLTWDLAATFLVEEFYEGDFLAADKIGL